MIKLLWKCVIFSLFNRRDFLTALAAVGTAAAVGSLIKLPHDTLLSVQENVLHTGYSYQYPEDGYVASTCLQCPAGCGIAVRVVSGRAVKIEGNPLHPINRGSICPKAHYGLQIVYDPDRVKGPMVKAAVVLPAMWVKRVLIVVPGLLNELRLPTV
jgi:anaerobic selenocysteine-containing dehydrogenase